MSKDVIEMIFEDLERFRSCFEISFHCGQNREMICAYSLHCHRAYTFTRVKQSRGILASIKTSCSFAHSKELFELLCAWYKYAGILSNDQTLLQTMLVDRKLAPPARHCTANKLHRASSRRWRLT